MPDSTTVAEPGLVQEFDYVVVGAGTAGCVLASRLSEDPGCSVVLLEAGTALEGQRFSAPGAAFSLQAPDSPWFWGDLSTPQDALAGRRVSVLAGRGLGGGSAVNGMLWFRGHPLDYDGWEAQGALGWGWASVAPVFRGIEHFDRGPDQHHGAGGPMVISGVRDLSPVSQAFMAAGAERGLAVNSDFNGEELDGIGPVQSNIRDGARFSVVDGYLRLAAHRENVTVRTDAPVASLVTEGSRVTGVRLVGGRGELRAHRGVVLAAGALRTPQLLMCSGIGPAEHLRELGIDVVLDLPGVGANLQDQPLVGGLWPVTGEQAPSDAWAGAQEPAYDMARRGPRASYMQVNAMLRSSGQEPAPDVQLIMGPLAADAAQGLGLAEPVPMYTCTPVLLTPDSRGTVRLASSDPQVRPLIDPGYLRETRDRQRLREALAWVHDELLTAPALRAVCGPSLVPSARGGGDALDADLTERASSSYHPVGTCRMGTDLAAVVDPHLAVRGIDGLHVADASVMPTSIRGNPQAAVVMIAERASAFLRDVG